MRCFIAALCVAFGGVGAQAADWPSQYSVGPSSDVARTPWWHQLGDPELSKAVDTALAGNPDLRAAHALHQQSKAIAMQQGSALFPVASLNAGASVAPVASLGFGFGIPTDPNAPKNYTLGQGTLDVQWQVDVFGRSVATWRAAQSDANAAQADAEGRDRSIASLVVGAYLDVVTARQRVQVLQAQLQINQDLLTAIELRYQGGDAGSLDVLQQRQQVASAKAGLPTARMLQQTTEQRLAVLQGLTPTTPVHTASALPPIDDEASIGAPSDLERNRPDLRASARRLRSARDRRWASVAGALPTLGASAQYGGQFIDRGELVSQSFWSVGGSLSMPLFNGGRHVGSVRQARAAYVVAEASHESRQLAALQQVESALVRERSQRELVLAQREQLHASDRAWTVAREQYLRGLTPFINVQNTLSLRQLAELSVIGGERDLLTARIAVHDAIGGTWIAANIKEVVP